MLSIIKKRKIWFGLSGVLIVASLVALVVFGLNLGIDFKGGSLTELEFADSRPEKAELEKAVTDFGLKDISVQTTEDKGYIVRTETIDEVKHQLLLQNLQEKYSRVEEIRYESIGPTIGNELKGKAIYALVMVIVAIVLYIAYAFRKVSVSISSWKFGLCAIVALFHDVIVVLGIFALLGKFAGVQIDSLFVVALLTVLGYSVNDTIVVFDRVRYNIIKSTSKSLEDTVEQGVNQTLVRSLNTSITTLLVLSALYLFGGATISWFILALIAGVVAGTYSSIFVASPLLVAWSKR
ncbi:protein translocase subunit SecF [Patescibacteria group bacterium]|nr:protein translocase subunit SecF [Patescibacteria group bacterium]